MHTNKLLGVLLSSLLLTAGCGTTENPKGAPSESTAPTKTAEAFAKEVLETGEAAATEKYKGKTLELEGVVDWANETVSKAVFLRGTRTDAGHPVPIHCFPATAEREPAMSLGKGQKVKVVGRVTILEPRGAGLKLEECKFTELTPSPVSKVTAEELTQAYRTDESAAKKKYQDIEPKSEILVEGTIQDPRASGKIVLAGDADFKVICEVDRDTLQAAVKGQKVIVKGTVSHFDKGGKAVNLQSAFILKKL